MNIKLTDILFVLVIFQLLFLSFFLFTQEKGRRISNILLGGFFLSISLNLLDVFLFRAGVYSSRPWMAGWGNCLPLLFGPLIYLFTQSVFEKDFSLSAKKSIHFLPFFLFFLVTEIYYLVQPRLKQEQILSLASQHHIPISVSVVTTLVFLLFLLYVVGALRLILFYKKDAIQHYSSNKQIDTSWLSSTIFFFLLIIILSILNSLLSQTPVGDFYLIGFNIIVLAMLFFIIALQIKALQRPHFFSFSGNNDPVAKPFRDELVVRDLEKIERGETAKLVLNYMQAHKPYLEPELSLEQLASRLMLKPRLLSQAINEILGQSFYDFINRHRIEEARRLLTNPKDEKITISEVLYEVGFNSKSSFYTLFKKYTGLTPSEFRKKNSF